MAEDKSEGLDELATILNKARSRAKGVERSENEMSNPKPGDFPIGSALSRAAARMILKNQRDSRKRIELVTNVLFSSPDFIDKQELDPRKPHTSDWQDFGEVLLRFVYVPSVEGTRHGVSSIN